MPFEFIDTSSRVDREGLRVFVLAEMKKFKEQSESIGENSEIFWNKLSQVTRESLFDEEKLKALKVIDQLVHLPQFIDTWISTALDTKERFDFFVMTKAHELNSGDQQKDYYWAMQIRHDQLVGLVKVVEMLIDKMKVWTSLRPSEVLDDPVFAGLTDYDVEQQVFLEAERIYKQRQKISGNKYENKLSSS